ncbi:MAG: hypothetical protein FWD98_07585 [Defluviitaleaceae bacterium]|nr:hypothetical protein [Defluviitaleaceae bacterium]
MTEVYALRHDADSFRVNREVLTALVSAEKRARLLRIRNFADASGVLAADLLLRMLISRRTGLRFAEISFGTARYGKPYLLGELDTPLHFNVSHSGPWVAVAIGGCPNGVDIQEHRALRGQDVGRAFFDQWVQREARLKCTGEGLTGTPNESLFTRSYRPDVRTAAAVCAVRDGFSDIHYIGMSELLQACAHKESHGS